MFRDNLHGMNILEIAIEAAGSVTELAHKLDVKTQVISNWRRRGGVPHMATRMLKTLYAKQISAAVKKESMDTKDDQPWCGAKKAGKDHAGKVAS